MTAAEQILNDNRSSEACYHCGEAVPPGSNFSLELQGVLQPMCCPGCQAVANLISDSGLERFYAQRTTFNRRPDALAVGETAADEFAVYDDPLLLEGFSARRENGELSARLLIGGITCAACTWLIEKTLLREEGVSAASVNLAQSRLDVTFDDSTLTTSTLFGLIASLGYDVKPWHSGERRVRAEAEHRRDARRLGVAGLGMMQVGMFAIALHAGELQGIAEQYRDLLRWVSLGVTTFVVLFSARGFFESAWRHLRVGALVMDLPVALAIGLAWIASAWATVAGRGDVYFDSVVMFTFLLLLARSAEQRMRYRDAVSWRDAEELLPDAVQMWSADRWQTVPRKTIQQSDRVLVRVGETIPVDAVIEAGSSLVREEAFNGESTGRSVSIGDTVYAGTLNTDAAIELRASSNFAQTRLAALQRSIDEASSSKPAISRVADRVAGRFIGAILALAAATAIYWWFNDPTRALWISLSVLVVSCPCALSLATPAALASAASLLRRRGVMLNSEGALETLSRCTHMIFDKTGTLTTGHLRLEATILLRESLDEDRLSAIASALQRHSNHPVASAFARHTPSVGVKEPQQVAGAGVEGCYEGKRIRMGSPSYCRELLCTFPEPPEQSELYWVGITSEDEALGWLGLADDTRAEAPGVLESLRSDRLQLALLSGDSSPRAALLARDLGLDEVYTGQSPEQKTALVAALQAQGAIVAMVGDGLNDAPVLSRANTSIAVSGATDLAKAHADFVLLRGDLTQLPALRRSARRAGRVIRQNFAWALGYNGCAIPLAAAGLVPPWAAAIGMSLSSLIVVANSLRLRRD